MLLEVADLAFPRIGLPDWTVTLVLALSALGFPIAIILTWAFDLTPEGIVRTQAVAPQEHHPLSIMRIIEFTVIGVLVITVGYLYSERLSLKRQVVSPSTGTVTEISKSIAVLPFVNMSGDPGNEYFSDGLSEEILNLLARIPDLKVIGRTSSFAFKGKNGDLRVIGQALGVKTVLEGSVRKSGDRLRITAQLIDVSDGAHIWSESYDRTMIDIFAVQDDVAAAIIDALQIHVGANPTRGRPTKDTAAYSLFLKARTSFNASKLREAEKLLLEVIELDPNFAEAYELLAYSYFAQSGWVLKAAEAQKLTAETAARALAIDPDLVFAQALYETGNLETYSLLRAIEAFERAARKQPGNPDTLRALFWYLLQAGYLQEALGVVERFVELEPLSPLAHSRLFSALYAVGRTGEAVAALELELQLGNAFAVGVLGAVNLVDNQDDSAIAHFEAFQQLFDADSVWVRELVTAARDPATGQAVLDHRIPQIVASAQEGDAYVLQDLLTKWYLYFGFLDRYFELILDLALDSTWSDAENLVSRGTVFRRLGFTAHPRYLEVAESLGITDVWEQRGPPDFCEKVGGKWICE
jgi:TolB-like protein/Flp pilus assembly protein TadD